MNENFLIYKSNIIEGLQDLSDYSMQKLLWFDNDQGLSYSFLENYLDLFDDSTLLDAYKAGETVFGKEADAALQDLALATDAIDESLPADKIIDDPFMKIVRKKAKKALDLVLADDGSESTIEIVKRPSLDVFK